MLIHDLMFIGSLVPATLWGPCLQSCTVLAAGDGLKEESPSPHQKRAQGRNEAPGLGCEQKYIQEVDER